MTQVSFYSSIWLSMNFHVITLFPELFTGFLSESIIGRAINDKKIAVNFVNPRDYVSGKYRKVWPDGNVMKNVDERPFGGGPGMVMRAEPIIESIQSILNKIEKENLKITKKNLVSKNKKIKKRTVKIIFFSPGGEMFTNDYATKTVDKFTDIIFICGRYEGIDARVYQVFKKVDHISIGNYVLTGGELPAMVCIDAMSRQISGVLGNFNSREESRASSHDVYTRPEVLVWNKKKYKVPPVLLTGNHKLIEEWKKQQNKDK